jgi:hypothetical protein
MASDQRAISLTMRAEYVTRILAERTVGVFFKATNSSCRRAAAKARIANLRRDTAAARNGKAGKFSIKDAPSSRLNWRIAFE